MKPIVFDIETDGLNPLENRITAIGIKTDKQEIVIMEEDERRMLERFWTFLSRFDKFRLIGFNNFNFDQYFLNIRCFKHNVKILDVKGRTIDLRFVLSNGNRFKNGKLGEYAFLLGFKKYSDLGGELVVDAWKNRKLGIIEKYLRQDLKITYAIMLRCGEIGLL